MRKIVSLLMIISVILISTSCEPTGKSIDNGVIKTVTDHHDSFSVNGYTSAIDDNYLVALTSKNSLKVIDLEEKKVIQTISIPNQLVAGFDIDDGKIVWSDLRNEKGSSKIQDYMETANADIFMYDLKTDKLKQITSNNACQINPQIWKNYIVWQDNRNDRKVDIYPEWDIYSFNLVTGEERQITTAPGIHTNPAIHDYKIVWEDGRNCQSDSGLRYGENVPQNNTDIYMYNLKTNQETSISCGSLQESNPVIYGSNIVWEDRNNSSLNADIVMYDLNKEEKKWITRDQYSQRNPQIFDHYLVWMDERRGTSAPDVIVNGKAPNSDIFMYDLNTGKESLMTGNEPQILPKISSDWLAFVTSRQVNPVIEVIRYK